MIKVECIVKVYEVNNKEVAPQMGDAFDIYVKSHFDNNKLVVISVGDHEFTVVARDLEAAIRNATTTARF